MFDAVNFTKGLAAVVRAKIAPLIAKTQDLEARLAALEKRVEAQKYCGIYDGREYKEGNSVTHSGSLWIARDDVQPGQEPGRAECWQLAVKKGRDGRDLRHGAA